MFNYSSLRTRKVVISEAVYSVIIPSWNNLPFLKLCIESIRKNSSLKMQIIIHLNEGKDGSLEWVQSQPELSYLLTKENVGVCYALNIARTLVETEHIVYLNDDMYVCPGWDAALMQEVQGQQGKLYFISGTAIERNPQSNCSIKGDYGEGIEDFMEEALLKEFDKLPMEDWQGATWPPNIIHRDLWDLVGGYSTEFSPGMYSDPDFSMKLWNAGIRYFKGVAASRVYHFGSVSTKKVKKNRGYYQFIAKWGFTSSTLTRYILRRGEKFDGPLKNYALPVTLRIKNFFKRIDLLFREY
ncbi:glycosyltransferase family 2 protein [Flavihumibacter sp. ZG627]|uniref:glycosyltransferase family 2 protein n=1 Tax=Flavihumibacter sp. ZG627 TaxID=1463156 RepID=UPI00069340BD|nr:glycosyltransferase [Flavihumibacter sp. ZG627]